MLRKSRLTMSEVEFDPNLVFRSNWKPPMGKGSRRDSRKRAYSEDDELDPMDPSSYSDAPRGGWYVCVYFRCSAMMLVSHLV